MTEVQETPEESGESQGSPKPSAEKRSSIPLNPETRRLLDKLRGGRDPGDTLEELATGQEQATRTPERNSPPARQAETPTYYPDSEAFHGFEDQHAFKDYLEERLGAAFAHEISRHGNDRYRFSFEEPAYVYDNEDDPNDVGHPDGLIDIRVGQLSEWDNGPEYGVDYDWGDQLGTIKLIEGPSGKLVAQVDPQSADDPDMEEIRAQLGPILELINTGEAFGEQRLENSPEEARRDREAAERYFAKLREQIAAGEGVHSPEEKIASWKQNELSEWYRRSKVKPGEALSVEFPIDPTDHAGAPVFDEQVRLMNGLRAAAFRDLARQEGFVVRTRAVEEMRTVEVKNGYRNRVRMMKHRVFLYRPDQLEPLSRDPVRSNVPESEGGGNEEESGTEVPAGFESMPDPRFAKTFFSWVDGKLDELVSAHYYYFSSHDAEKFFRTLAQAIAGRHGFGATTFPEPAIETAKSTEEPTWGGPGYDSYEPGDYTNHGEVTFMGQPVLTYSVNGDGVAPRLEPNQPAIQEAVRSFVESLKSNESKTVR